MQIYQRFSGTAGAKFVYSAHSLLKDFFKDQLYESDYFAHFVTESYLFSNALMFPIFFNFKTFFFGN